MTARLVQVHLCVNDPRNGSPAGLGQKPAAFYAWLFQLLGALPDDEFVDVFPGSGGAAMAWEAYRLAAARHDGSQPGAHDASHVATRDASCRRATTPAGTTDAPVEFRLRGSAWMAEVPAVTLAADLHGA